MPMTVSRFTKVCAGSLFAGSVARCIKVELPDSRAFRSIGDIQADILGGDRIKALRPPGSDGCSLKDGFPGIIGFVFEREGLNALLERFVDEYTVKGAWSAEVDFNPGLGGAGVGSPTGMIIIVNGLFAAVVGTVSVDVAGFDGLAGSKGSGDSPRGDVGGGAVALQNDDSVDSITDGFGDRYGEGIRRLLEGNLSPFHQLG